MPKFTSKTDGSRTISPGGYDVYSIHITLANGNITDVKSLVQEIEIVESLNSASIQVIARLYDGINFLENSHLVGGEKVNIKIRRTANIKESFSESRDKFDIEVFIAAIVEHNTPKPGLQAYTIECVSQHALISTSKRLNRSFNGVIGQLVTNIFTNDLHLKDSIDYLSENISDSTDQIKGIYPSLSPLEALTWLTRNSSNDGTPYFLYETIKEGLNFKSYNDMITEELYQTYNDATFSVNTPNTAESYEELEKKILSLNSDLNRSLYDSISNGSYSSKLHTLDIATKKYKQTHFTYKNQYKLDSNNPFTDKIEFDNKKINEYDTNKQYYVSLNSKAFKQDMNYHKPVVSSLLNKQSYHNNLGFMGLDMEIYGDFDISVGRKVGVIIPKANDSVLAAANRNFTDKYLGGTYIITSISHFFSQSDYRCSVGLQKDSIGIDLDSDIEIGKKNRAKPITKVKKEKQNGGRKSRKRSRGQRILGKL